MKNTNDNLQWQDTLRAPVPNIEDLQRRIIVQAQETSQLMPVKSSRLSVIAKKVKQALVHHLALPVGGAALALSVALVFLIDDFLLPEKENVTSPPQVLATVEQSDIEEGLDWDTYFLFETEMVIAQL